MHKRTAHRWRVGAMIGGGGVRAGQLLAGAGDQPRRLRRPNDVPKSEPDYIVEKFSFVRMTLAGKPRYIVSGDKLTHHPDSDIADVVRPVVQNLSAAAAADDDDGEARRASTRSSNVVDLMGNVDIERPAAARRSA